MSGGKKAGIKMLVHVELVAGSGEYHVLGGQTASTMTINNAQIDVTDKLGNDYRCFLEGFGTRSLSLSASGFCENSSTLEKVLEATLNNAALNAQITFDPDEGEGTKMRGRFMFPTFEITGEVAGAQSYSSTMESTGVFNYSKSN